MISPGPPVTVMCGPAAYAGAAATVRPDNAVIATALSSSHGRHHDSFITSVPLLCRPGPVRSDGFRAGIRRRVARRFARVTQITDTRAGRRPWAPLPKDETTGVRTS